MHSSDRKVIKLRWRFDYPGYTRVGCWDANGETMKTKAVFQPREDLVNAIIEATDKSQAVYCACTIVGSDFRSFQWIAETRIPNVMSFRGALKIPPRIIGAMMVTRTHTVKIFCNGTSKVDPLGG